MLDVVTAVDDGDDARRAPQGVILAVSSQFLKAFGTNYFLRVIPTKWHLFDIFSDMISGIRILSHIIFSASLSGILSGISSEIFCGWGPAGNTLIIKFDVFCCCCCCCCCCCYCCCCCCCCLLFLFLFFFVVVVAAVTLGGWKNAVNTLFFFASEAQKTRYLRCVFASGNKNHGIYSVFWPVPSKNTRIYGVFSMLQEVFFPCKIGCLGSALGVRGGIAWIIR